MDNEEMPEEFMRSCCHRVVTEGIVSAMKNIFGVLVRSRKRHNQDVEVLFRMVLWDYIDIEPEELWVNTDVLQTSVSELPPLFFSSKFTL